MRRGAWWIALAAILLLLVRAQPLEAQSIAASKDLCVGSGSQQSCISQGATPSVPANTPVTYPITLFNNGSSAVNVDLAEQLPSGFVFTGSTCGPANPPITGPGVPPTFFGPITVPPASSTNCAISGYYVYALNSQNNASNSVTVFASGDHSTPLATSNLVNAVVSGTTAIPTNVTVGKTAQILSIGTDGSVTVQYQITITNTGQNDVYGIFLQDRLSLPATGVPLIVSYGGGNCAATTGSSCFGTAPSVVNSPVTVSSTSQTDFAQWSYPSGSPGMLAAGGSMTLTYTATISSVPGLDCVIDPNGNFLVNEAHISFNAPGASTTVNDTTPADNTATTQTPITINQPIDPHCGQSALQVTKTLVTPQPSGGFNWGSTLTYEITLTNVSTTQTLSNLQLTDPDGGLGDVVRSGVGTPPFSATYISYSCAATVCSGSVPASPATQPLSGYGAMAWMFGTNVYAPPSTATLAPGQSVSFQLSLKYDNAGCDSYPDVTLKPVLNYAVAAYDDSLLGHREVWSEPVIALMKATPTCAFTATKDVDAGQSKIAFGPPATVSYTVGFNNPTDEAVTIGTLIDTLRIVQPTYATVLPVTYSYSCAPSAGTVTGYPASGSGGPLSVVHTSLPQQGVRVIENSGPVVFQPQSTLTCHVTLTVSRPAPGDPNCSRTGSLQNAAIMDTSAFYNPNLPWPPETGSVNAAEKTLPLPQCLNLVVNKTADPNWATEQGAPQNNALGPLNYTLTVTNLGDPILPADGVALSDNFTTPGYTAFSWMSQCTPTSSGCTPTPWWNPNPTANPSSLYVKKLNQGQQIVTHFRINGPFPPAPAQLCNQADMDLDYGEPLHHNTHLAAGDWYPKDPGTWQTQLCVPIFEVRPLDINKQVTVVPPATMPPATNFPVGISCSYAMNGTQYGPQGTLIFNNPPNPATLTWFYIPVGSVCTMTEQLPTAPVAMSSCPSGYGGWQPPAYFNPMSNASSPSSQSVTIVTTEPNRFQVQNSFACLPPGQFTLQKAFEPPALATELPPSSIFPVKLTCAGHPAQTINLTAPSFQTLVTDMPLGVNCSVEEETPIGTDTQANCQWQTSYPNGQQFSLGGGTPVITVLNKRSCTGTLYLYKTFEPASLGGQMPPAAIFPVQLVCTSGGTTTVNLGPANQYQYVTQPMPEGTVCNITELDPLNVQIPGNCQWTKEYTKGQSVTIPSGTASLIVQNSQSCVTPTSSSLNLIKTTNNISAIGMPNPPFPVTVDCGTGAPVTVSILAGGGAQQATGLPIGGNCTITETPSPMVPPTPSYCYWVTSLIWDGQIHPNGSQIDNVQGLPDPRTVEVHNDFNCVYPPTTLQIKKTIIYDTVNITNQQQGDFDILLSCVNPAWTQTVTLTHANNYQVSVPGLPIGSICNIDEILPQNPNPLPAGSQWVATYPQGQQIVITGGLQTLPLQNERVNNTAQPGQAALYVSKTLAVGGGSNLGYSITFPITVSCVDQNGAAVPGFPTIASLAPSMIVGQTGVNVDYYAAANYAVPVGSTCSVNEPAFPPIPSGLSFCQWSSSSPSYTNYPYGGSQQAGPSVNLTVSQQGYRLDVLNRLNCPLHMPPPNGGNCTGDKILTNGGCGTPIQCKKPLVPNATGSECVCPAGTTLSKGQCVKPVQCKLPFVPNADRSACVCPAGTTLSKGQCVKPVQCKTPFVLNADRSACVCPAGTTLSKGQCVKPLQCKAPFVLNAQGSDCVCPEGTTLKSGRCVPTTTGGLNCKSPFVPNGEGTTCICPAGTTQSTSGRCVPATTGGLNCKAPFVPNGEGTACVCPAGTSQSTSGRCVPATTGGLNCKPPFVPNGEGTACVCPAGTSQSTSGRCVPATTGGLNCKAPAVPNGEGTACICPAGMVLKLGRCVPQIQCEAPMVPNVLGTGCACPKGTALKDGQCVKTAQ